MLLLQLFLEFHYTLYITVAARRNILAASGEAVPDLACLRCSNSRATLPGPYIDTVFVPEIIQTCCLTDMVM